MDSFSSLALVLDTTSPSHSLLPRNKSAGGLPADLNDDLDFISSCATLQDVTDDAVTVEESFIVSEEDLLPAEPLSPTTGSSMIRGAGGGDFLTNKTFKDDLNVIQSAIEEKERNDYKEETLLTAKADLYTSTTGSYIAWETDVNLGPPLPDIPVPAEDVVIHSYYNALQYTLYETGYPETEDRSNVPINVVTTDRITIAILSSPVECMGILLEGGQQCPGDILLVLSTSWVTKQKSSQKNGAYSLFVRKAITFESAGRTFIDVFNPPRRVTYFINFLTRGCTDGARDDGEELELDLDCPMSSSLTLSRIVDDKLWTRIMMADAGLLFPETLAFTFCSTLPYDTDNGQISIISLDTKLGVENLLLEEIQKFVSSSMMQKHDKIVVKPSGVMWHGSVGVSYHPRADIVGIWKAALKVLSELEEENVVLVEAFYDTFHPRQGGPSCKWAASENHACRVRSTVCRGPDNAAHMTKVTCGVGLKKDPVNGDNTMPQSLDTTLIAFGISDASLRASIRNEIQRASENLLESIFVFENKMSPNERGGLGAQTDLVGIDFVLADLPGGRISPIGIEVNSHDCTINCQVCEFMNPETKGEAFHILLQTMIMRSQRFLMRGKKVLVVGAAGYSKKFIWPAARDYNIDVILIDHNPEHFATKQVSMFIRYDLTDHTRDDVHARNIIQLIAEKEITIDGCITFWEDCGPLAAHICELLGLTGPGLKGALTAKKKSATQNILQQAVGDIPQWPRTYLYASKSFHISCRADIEEAAVMMEFPCVMKLEYGSSAVGVTLVQDVMQCHREWSIVQDELLCESCHPGIGLGHGNTMLMMDFIGGTEHDVDIIIYKRRLVGAFVSDNGPTRLPKFTETAAAMPTHLPNDKRRQLIVAAYQCCVEIGLVSGVFNVELKLTPTGPKLLEINARMGGFYLRDWIMTLYNVDILFCAFMIACGIKPVLFDSEPVGQLVGVMTIPSAHRAALQNPANLKLMHLLEEHGVIRVNRLEQEMPPPDEDRYEEPFLNIAVLDESLETAKTKLIGVFSLLGLNTKEYQVDEYLKDFKRS